jgi:hypothetical protein
LVDDDRDNDRDKDDNRLRSIVPAAPQLPGGLAPPEAKFRERKEAAQFDKQKEWREVRPKRPRLAPHLFL